MPGFDLHQHLWPDAFVTALAARSRPPMLRRDGLGWRLFLAGEPSCPFDPAEHDPALRADALSRAGLHRAALAPSSPLGIEGLPADEAQPLLDAWLDGVLELGSPFAVWGALPLDGATGATAAALLDRGAIGIALPAGALDGPGAVERLQPVLATLEDRDAPLFVHPGPGFGGARALPGGPAPWWPALTAYLAQLQAAWLAFATWGRPQHPRLRVLFAALAGGAPLHAERIAARGGPARGVHDRLVFYDTSSYGPQALDAAIRAVGIDGLVFGSDAPVVGPPQDPAHGLGQSVAAALTLSNPARLLHGTAALAATAETLERAA
jgi:6-methylsalicylate decarboxylase